MFPVNKNDIQVLRTREQIKFQVERFKSLSKTDEQIVEFLEGEIDKELGLYNFFDSVHELADYVGIPVKSFRISWL